jgi:uncharacterized protein YndB with AHSA1/START domain
MAKFEHSIDISAPVDTVWSILTDSAQWPLWFPDLQGVTGLSAVQTGAKFQWQSGGQTGTGSIGRVEPQHILQVVTAMEGHQATHTFRVERHGGLFGGNGAQLNYTLEFKTAGGMLGELVAGGNPVDLLKVKNAVTKVHDLAEREAGHR